MLRTGRWRSVYVAEMLKRCSTWNDEVVTSGWKMSPLRVMKPNCQFELAVLEVPSPIDSADWCAYEPFSERLPKRFSSCSVSVISWPSEVLVRK
jgi:hypothetical protein